MKRTSDAMLAGLDPAARLESLASLTLSLDDILSMFNDATGMFVVAQQGWVDNEIGTSP